MASASITDLKTAAPQRALADMKPKEQIAHLLEQKRGEIAKMLPKHLHADRLLKVAQIAATTTPALLKCDVPSLVAAIGQCAQMGLEPNTVLGHAYLVPFNVKRKDANGNERWVNSVQVIVGYKGLIDLARRSGQIVSITAHEVCENDDFECVYGLNERLEHRPAMNDRGEVVAFYAVAHLKDGGHAFEVMSVEQITEIRDNSQGWQQAKKYKKEASSPWGAHFVEMGRKTVIRRLAKYLPLSIEFQTAAALDDMAAGDRDQNLAANTIDGTFTLVPEADADGAPIDADDQINPETGEIAQPTAAQDVAPRVENSPSPDAPTMRADRPTDAEMAAFAAEDAAREQQQAQPARRRQQMNIE